MINKIIKVPEEYTCLSAVPLDDDRVMYCSCEEMSEFPVAILQIEEGADGEFVSDDSNVSIVSFTINDVPAWSECKVVPTRYCCTCHKKMMAYASKELAFRMSETYYFCPSCNKGKFEPSGGLGRGGAANDDFLKYVLNKIESYEAEV